MNTNTRDSAAPEPKNHRCENDLFNELCRVNNELANLSHEMSHEGRELAAEGTGLQVIDSTIGGTNQSFPA